MTKFKTKIVQRFLNGHEFYELPLPDGRRVASGSIDHCWDERERWEDVLATSQNARNYYREHPEELQLKLNF